MQLLKLRCVCGTAFSTPEEFAKHRETDHGLVECCGVYFNDSAEYARHIRVAHGLDSRFPR
ncbi:MAG: hypothetical protein HYZ12_00565 [Thaumarchaeota archaeon]|nr:hypothetical protein [Nitrososphaerota archaeon]